MMLVMQCHKPYKLMLSTRLNMVMTWGFPDVTLAFHILHHRMFTTEESSQANGPKARAAPFCWLPAAAMAETPPILGARNVPCVGERFSQFWR